MGRRFVTGALLVVGVTWALIVLPCADAAPGDGGATWTWEAAARVVAAGPPGAGMAGLQIAFNNTRIGGRDDQGRLHLVWSDGSRVVHGVLAADGAFVPSVVAEGGRPNKPTLAVLERGLLLVAWGAAERPGRPRACVSVSRDGGASWSAAETVSAGAAGNLSLRGFRQADGDAGAVLAWHDDGDGRIRSAAWDGRQWSKPVAISVAGVAADVAIAGDGPRTLACWEQAESADARAKSLFHAGSEDGGRTWSRPTPVRFAGEGAPRAQQDPCVDFDGRGGVLLGFQGAGRVYAARAEPGESAFRMVGVLGPGLFAHVEMGDHGVAACAWEHFASPRDMRNEGAKTVGLALSRDGGQSFDGPHAMPDSDTAFSAMQGAVLVSRDWIDVVWVQSTEAGKQIRHRAARVP